MSTALPPSLTPEASVPPTPSPTVEEEGYQVVVEPVPAQPSKAKKRRRFYIEWGIIFVVAVVFSLLIRIFVFQTFLVPSTSMYPTLKAGDRIVVNKLSYHLHPINRGDIVVFSRPPREEQACGSLGAPPPYLVKRVIGLPNQWISMTHGTIYITTKAISTPWLPSTQKGTTTRSFARQHIPKNNYFVMGDNRTRSCDSRYWGTVPKSTIVGEVEYRVWPISRLHNFT